MKQALVVQRWQRRRDPGDKVLIQGLLFQRFLALAVYRSEGPTADIELQIASNSMSGVFDWVRTATAPEEQAAPTVQACECRLLNTQSILLERCSTNTISRIHGHLMFGSSHSSAGRNKYRCCFSSVSWKHTDFSDVCDDLRNNLAQYNTFKQNVLYLCLDEEPAFLPYLVIYQR